jgi:hypothetical protein
MMLQLAGVAGVGRVGRSAESSLFDGKTLDGWIQVENNATTLSSAGMVDAAAFVSRLSTGTDAVSQYLRSRLPEELKRDLAAYNASSATARATMTSLTRELNQAIAGASLYDRERFRGIALRPETEQLRRENPQGYRLSRFNKLLLEDAYTAELARSVITGWTVKDGAMASTGVGRGVIYTAKDYSRFRLMFTMRHVSGNPDHQACVLIFCTRPLSNERPLDALGGIQFQPPNGGHWDYRPGMNNAGNDEFTRTAQPRFDAHEWSRVEIVADASKGTARMAVAQPVGSKAVEVLRFQNQSAGRPGPVAWQMHNPGLFDEFKDVMIDDAPSEDALLTAR